MMTEFSSSAVEVVILFDIYVPLGKTGMNELEQWFSKWYHEHKDNRGIFFLLSLNFWFSYLRLQSSYD